MKYYFFVTLLIFILYKIKNYQKKVIIITIKRVKFGTPNFTTYIFLASNMQIMYKSADCCYLNSVLVFVQTNSQQTNHESLGKCSKVFINSTYQLIIQAFFLKKLMLKILESDFSIFRD